MALALAGGLHLTPRQRRVVVLRLSRFGRREIAEQLAISIETVRYHLDEARAVNGCADEVSLLIAFDRERLGHSTT